MEAAQPQSRKRRWPLVIWLVVFLLLGFAVWKAVQFIDEFGDTMDDVYSAMQVGYMIADYIEDTDEWPTGWEDLAAHHGEDPAGEYFTHLKQRVGVDWSADLQALATASDHESAPFPVVWCHSGNPAGPTEDNEANYVIHTLLQSKESRPDQATDPLDGE